MTDMIVDSAPAPGRVARKRAEVRRKLLLAGFDLVGQCGLDAFAVADLTEAADCSKGAFYSHFANRDEFIADLIAHGVETVGVALDRHGAGLPGDEALAVGLRYSLTLAQQQPRWGRFVAAVAGSARPTYTGLGERLASDIARAHAEGRLDYRDAQAVLLLASGTFLAAVIGSGLDMLRPGTPNEATRHLLIGIGVEADRALALTTVSLPVLIFDSVLVSALDVSS